MRKYIAAVHQFHRSAICHSNLHGKLIFVVHSPSAERQPDLLEVVHAVDPTTGCPGPRQQEQNHQDKQNRDHATRTDDSTTTEKEFKPFMNDQRKWIVIKP